MDEPTAYCGPPENDDGDRKYSCRCGTEDPVQGAADTEGGPLIPEKVGPTPEPDVLERLKQIQPQKNYVGIDMRQLLADAIAEIECERAEHAECCETLAKMDGQLVRAAQLLRQYTEAEVVWQARRIVYGHAFGWSGIHKSEVDDYTTRRNCEVRRLIVAPKGETEGKGTE